MQEPAWYRYANTFCDPRFHYLLIGGLGAAEDDAQLMHLRVTYVYTFMELPLAGKGAPGIVYRHFYARDSTKFDMLAPARAAYAHLDRDRRHPNARILLHCRAGMSRSAFALLYHLMRSWRMLLADAYALLKEARPIVDPNDAFKQVLCEWNNSAEAARYLSAIAYLHRSLPGSSARVTSISIAHPRPFMLHLVGSMLPTQEAVRLVCVSRHWNAAVRVIDRREAEVRGGHKHKQTCLS